MQLSQPSLPVSPPPVLFAPDEQEHERQQHCAWCWKKHHPDGEPYPETWSTTICMSCEAAMRAALDQHRHARTLERISSCTERLVRQHRAMGNLVACFCNQPAMLPLQVETAMARLGSLQRACQQCQYTLETLHPQETRQLRPYRCLARLVDLEYKTAEALLTLAMFVPICQSLLQERIALHLALRELLHGTLVALEDVMSQLAALSQQEAQV
jgi:hypothetical protein